MKTINLIEKQIETYIEGKRPPVEFRDRLDVGFYYENGIVEIFEIRPVYGQVNEKMNLPIAKAKFIKSQSLWVTYWMTSKMKC